MCNDFSRFQFATALIHVNVVAMMMFLRVHALYHGRKLITGGLLLLLFIQFTMFTWLLTRVEAVVHNPLSGVRACMVLFDPKIGIIADSASLIPLLYDTVVLVLVLYRTLPSIRDRNVAYMMRRFLEDGLAYYTAIFAVSLVLAIMVVVAPPAIKNITGQLHVILSVAMMSRITINMQRSIHKAFGNQRGPKGSTSARTQSRSYDPNETMPLDTIQPGVTIHNEAEDEDRPLGGVSRKLWHIDFHRK